MFVRGALFLRYLTVNIVGVAVLVAVWLQGWLTFALATDAMRLSLVIVAAFLIGLALAGRGVWRFDRAAAAGGFTTVVTMPNTDPAIDNPGLVRYVIDRGKEAGLCRVLPTGAISVGSGQCSPYQRQ